MLIVTRIRPLQYDFHPLEHLQREVTGPVWEFTVYANGKRVSEHRGPWVECMQRACVWATADPQETRDHRTHPHPHLPEQENTFRPAWARRGEREPDRQAMEEAFARTFGIERGRPYDDSMLRRPQCSSPS